MPTQTTDSPSTATTRTTIAAALGYLAIVAVLFHRLLIGQVLSPAANLWAEVPFVGEVSENLTPYLNGVQGDVWREFEPSHRWQYESAQSGRYPLWNPHIYCGFPFHGDGQSAMLSPFHWPYFVVDPKWAAGPMAALKLWVAGFAAYCLSRRLGMVPAGAFVAGTAWMLCAFNVRWLLWNHSAATAWLPLVLLTLDRLLERATWRRLALAGLAATALQLSGHPQTQFHAGLLAGLYVLVRAWLNPGRLSITLGRVLACLTAQTLGLAGAAISLWPFAEQLPDSFSWVEGIHGRREAMPLEALLGAIAPDHFGRPRAGRFYQGPLNYNEAGLYFGLLPLALAVTALLSVALSPRKSRVGPAHHVLWIFTVWLAFCILIVFGVPGVNVLIERIPILSQANNLRLVLGIQFSGAMLAGAAWTRLTLSPNWLQRWLLMAASCGVAAGLCFLLLVHVPVGLVTHRDDLVRLWTDSTVPSPLEHRSLRTLVSAVAGLVVAGWSVLCARALCTGVAHGPQGHSSPSNSSRSPATSGRPSHLCVAATFALVVSDLAWVAFDFTPMVPPHIVRPPIPEGLSHVIEKSGQGRVIATDNILPPNLAMSYGFRDVRGVDFPLDRRWAKLFTRLRWQPIVTLLPGDQVRECVRPVVQSVLDKCAVHFLYTKWPRESPGPPQQLRVCSVAGVNGSALPAWKVAYRGSGARQDLVYENPSAYPRAYFAGQVSYVSRETALDAVTDVTLDFRAQSFVEEPLDLSNRPANGPPGEATVAYDQPEEVRIRTRSTSTALLVLADRYDPNWYVTIDGEPARSIQANYLFRGVVVPAGEHEVRWTYRPGSFRWGRVVSISTVAGLVVLLFIRTRASGNHAVSGGAGQVPLPPRAVRDAVASHSSVPAQQARQSGDRE